MTTATKQSHRSPKASKASVQEPLAGAMTPRLRKQKIAALSKELTDFWKGKPNSGALTHLLVERGAKA
jgi:hypothetical protein